ncbi:hypothetical protein HDU67_004767 [Dinochytrium kinnereticum]|nr:hypothetical protein HDU67_004767 [Dinochytrium kinnereticum]
MPTPFPSPNPVPSYWLEGVHLPNHLTDAHGPLPQEPFDAAIIGGGISGFSVAYHLARVRPEWRIAVVEARDVAGGATGRNGGLLWPGLSDSLTSLIKTHGLDATLSLLAFDHLNLDAIETFATHLSSRPAGTHQPLHLHPFPKGGFTTLDTLDDLRRAETEIRELERHGFKEHGLRVLSRDEFMRVTGYRFPKGVVGAVVNSHARHVVPARLALGLAREFLDAPGGGKRKVFLDALVVDVLDVDADLLGLRTRHRGTLFARNVVHATNAWTSALIPNLPITPIRNHVLVTSPLPPPLHDQLAGWCLSAQKGYVYMSCRDDGRVVIGGFRHLVEGMEVGVSEDGEVVGEVGEAIWGGKAVAEMMAFGKASDDFPAKLFEITKERLEKVDRVGGFESKM